MNRLIRLPELTKRLGIGKTKLYAMVKNGQFPKPVKLGNVSVWSSEKVSRWISGVDGVDDDLKRLVERAASGNGNRLAG